MADISAAKLARFAVEALQAKSQVVFTAAKYVNPEKSKWATPETIEVSWDPETALAVAGHICQHWGGVSTRRLIVEHWRSLVVTLRFETGTGPYRLNVGERQEGPWVGELCGHDDCAEPAPAGPGSRCPRHFGDPAPAHEHETHWAQIAAEAWRTKHPTAGEEKRLLDNARNSLVAGALSIGMRPINLYRATGIARTTIDRIDTSQRAPELAGDLLDGPA